MDVTLAESRAAIAKGSSSFSAAAALFDRATREDAWFLYAWCRYCDDQIDGQELGHNLDQADAPLTRDVQRQRLAELVEQTRAAMAGVPTSNPTFDALQRVCRRADLPARYPLELLEGMAMDVEDARYETIEDTLAYCWHVAGTVGVMMAHVMGARDPSTLRRAQDLGLALQLTNIARDVVSDAGVGRLYLPSRWLREAAAPATPQAIAAAGDWSGVHGVALRLLDVAEPYYGSARMGLRALPLRSALAIAAAGGVYRQIGRKLRRKGPQAWRRRVRVSTAMKLWLFLLAGVEAVASRFAREQPRAPMWTRI